MAYKSNIDTQLRGFYFAASGNDDFSGKTIEVPKLTIQAAIDETDNLIPVPSTSDIALVTSSQGGSFTEGFVLNDFVQFNGQDTTIIAAASTLITLGSGLRCRLTSATNTQAAGITFQLDGVNLVDLSCERIQASGAGGIGINIAGTVDNIFIEPKQLVVDGVGAIGLNIESTTTSPIDTNFDTVQLQANNTVFVNHNPVSSTDATNISVSTVESTSFTGTTAFLVQNGEMTVPVAGQITADTVIRVTSGAKLIITSNNMTGDILVETGGTLECNIGTITGDITVESGAIVKAYIYTHTGTLSNDGTIFGFIGDVSYSDQLALSFKKIGDRDIFFSSNLSTLITDMLISVKTGGTYTTFTWTGDTNPSTYDSELWVESSINVGPGTLFLGSDGMSLSSAARTVNFIDAYGSTGIPIGTIYDETGNLAPFQFDFAASNDTSVTDVFDTNLSDPQTMLFAVGTNDSITRAYSVRPATAGNLRVRAFAGSLTTDPVILDTRITIIAGQISTVVEIALANNILIQVGDDVLLEFSGIQLEGGLQTSGAFIGQTVPFLNADFAVLTRRDLVVQGDSQTIDTVVFLDGSTQSHGATRSADDWHIFTSIFKQSFDVSTQDDEPEAVFFRDDGLKLYIVGSENGLVYEYDLSPSWDVSTASFLQSFDPSITNITGVFFRPNGLQMFLLNIVLDEVEEFVLTTAWDISTASTVQTIALAPLGGGTLPHDIYFKPDGSAFYISEIADEDVEQYDMTTVWDISTATLTTTFTTAVTDFAASFKIDGTMMYAMSSEGAITEYTLTTPWLVDTAEVIHIFDALLTSARGLFFKPDGSKFYTIDESSDTVREYNIGLETSAPLHLRIPLSGGTAGINFVNEASGITATIQYEDATQNLALSAVEMSISASDVLALSADGITLDTTGEITINSDIFIDDIGQRILITSVGGTGTPSFELADASFNNKLVIEYDQQINNVNITGTVDTTIDTTSGSTFIHSANSISLDARSGTIDLESTGNITFNTLIRINSDGQIITLKSDSATGTPTIRFDDSSNALGGSIVFDETDDDLEVTAVLGDLRLLSTSADIELLPGSGLTSVNFSEALSTLHVFEDTATTSSETGVTIEQDGAGDALIHFTLTGLQDWTLGVDNSISDGFAIATGLSLTIDPVFFIETGGDIGFGTSNPNANLHISDLSGAVINLLLVGQDGQFLANVAGNGQVNLQSSRTTGVVNYGFQGLPVDGTSGVNFRFGVSSGSTGDQRIQLFEPNGAVIQTEFCTSGGDSFINSQGGGLAIGQTSANSSFQVVGSIAKSIVAKTAAYTLTSLDYTVTGDATSAAFTLTLPTAVGITGRIYVLKKIDSSINIVTVDADGSETIDGALTYDLTDEGESITIQSDGANWIII